VPYRIDVRVAPPHALEALIDLGALDVEPVEGGVAALMPDVVPLADISHALGATAIRVSPAVGRDDDSVWTLGQRAVRTRMFAIVPAGTTAEPGALRIADGPAFGTGQHPTTALCLQILEDEFERDPPVRQLDVGTGSGILALASLRSGVPRAVGLDVDDDALQAAAENAQLNALDGRLLLVRGGPDAVRGSWPFVVANIRAAEIMEMAHVLSRRVASGGRLVLSGVPRGVAEDVERTYRRAGMTRIGLDERAGWAALLLRASW
jgi:ribosomal protein L11 methylase PrmA